ncbi:MAG: zinc-ribbon domain-containing protein [Candidatus Helarchaeota archaeon]
MGIIICPQCGAQSNDTQRFCTKCGASLGRSSSTKPLFASDAAEPVQNVPTTENHSHRTRQVTINSQPERPSTSSIETDTFFTALQNKTQKPKHKRAIKNPIVMI